MQSVLESKEHTQSGWKGQRYSKLPPELKAEIGRHAAEHSVAAQSDYMLKGSLIVGDGCG